MDETARHATGVHARQVRFVRGKAKFCSLVATLCGVLAQAKRGWTLGPRLEAGLLVPYIIVREPASVRYRTLPTDSSNALADALAASLRER